MSKYAAASTYVRINMQGSCRNERVSAPGCLHVRFVQSKYSCGSYKLVQLSTWNSYKLQSLAITSLKAGPHLREGFLRCNCLGTLVNADGPTASEWIPVVDQVLLMASVCLTYMAGVIPFEKSFFNSEKINVDENVMPESKSVSGSALKNSGQVDLNFAWDVVKGKLMDSLNAIEEGGNLRNRVINFEQNQAKRPLSLYAVAGGPRLRLLRACLQHLQEEVNSISDESVNMNDWLKTFDVIIQKSCQPVCMAWLEKELSLDDKDADEALLSIISEKLKGDDNILQNIRKSGKEDLYSELLCYLRCGSHWERRCYDNSLYTSYGVAVLEDLVITLADGIASIYLELISVDGNMSNEVNSPGSILCTLSTRELQKLRNEVALHQWLHMNMKAIISMYEDHFDLCTLQIQLIEEPSKSQTDKFSWWKKLTLGKSGFVSSTYSYAVISPFSLPVKRTKELRALTGWRYYFSLFLELSDIAMPVIRIIVDKVSSAISFLLVCLIGRSLGLIYTGIRQSLRWR